MLGAVAYFYYVIGTAVRVARSIYVRTSMHCSKLKASKYIIVVSVVVVLSYYSITTRRHKQHY